MRKSHVHKREAVFESSVYKRSKNIVLWNVVLICNICYSYYSDMCIIFLGCILMAKKKKIAANTIVINKAYTRKERKKNKAKSVTCYSICMIYSTTQNGILHRIPIF